MTPTPPAAAPQDDPQAAARLTHLFRHSLAAHGTVNPLLPLLRQYRGVSGPLQAPPAAAPHDEPAPRAPVARDALDKAVVALPSLPQAVQKALSVLQDEGASAVAIAECIEHDQALVARTLRAANAGFYGAPGRVATIRTAISILGLRAVSAMLTAAALSSRFALQAAGVLDFRPYWRHSLTAAVIARELARPAGLDPDTAFTAGMLHDVGVLVLAEAFPQAWRLAHEHALRADLPLWQAERLVMDVDHALAGECVARRWHLPETIAAAIAGHHVPPSDVATAPATLTDLVHVADALTHGLAGGDCGTDADAVPDVSPELWARLKLDRDACLAALRTSHDAVDALCEALLP